MFDTLIRYLIFVTSQGRNSAAKIVARKFPKQVSLLEGCVDEKATDSFRDQTFQLITLAVCCGYVLTLIGRRTINIPEIVLAVHGLMGFT